MHKLREDFPCLVAHDILMNVKVKKNNHFQVDKQSTKIWEPYIVSKLSMLTKTSPIIPESLL